MEGQKHNNNVPELEEGEVILDKNENKSTKTKSKKEQKKNIEFPNKTHYEFVSSTYKSRPCEFYKKGGCHKGPECTFSHDFIPEKIKQLCKFYLGGACNKINCMFSHNLEDFPCKYHHVLGYCDSGTFCPFSHQEIKNDQNLKDFIKENEEFIKENLEKYGNLKILPEYQVYLKENQKLNINSNNNNNIKTQLIHPGFDQTSHEKELLAKNESIINTPITNNIAPLPIFQKIIPNKQLSSIGYYSSPSQNEMKFNENMNFPSIKNANINKNPFPSYDFPKHYEQEPFQNSIKFPPFINDVGLNKNYPINFLNSPKQNMSMTPINMNPPNMINYIPTNQTLRTQIPSIPNLNSNHPPSNMHHNSDHYNSHKSLIPSNHNILLSPVNNNFQQNHHLNNFQQQFNFANHSKNMNPLFNNTQPNPNFANPNAFMSQQGAHFPSQNNIPNNIATKSINNIINHNEMHLNISFDNIAKNYHPMHPPEQSNLLVNMNPNSQLNSSKLPIGQSMMGKNIMKANMTNISMNIMQNKNVFINEKNEQFSENNAVKEKKNVTQSNSQTILLESQITQKEKDSQKFEQPKFSQKNEAKMLKHKNDANNTKNKKIFNNDKKNWKSNYTSKTHSKISKTKVSISHKTIHKDSINKPKEIFKNKKPSIAETKQNDPEISDENLFFFSNQTKEKLSEKEKDFLLKLDKILFSKKNRFLEKKKKEDLLIEEKFENVKISQETRIDSERIVSETVSQKELLSSLRFLFLNCK